MFKLLLAVLGLIGLTLVAGVYFQFDPAWPVLGILAFGVYMVGRIGGPALPPGGSTHWGSGHGIYFDRDDAWVAGSNEDESGAAEDEREARRR